MKKYLLLDSIGIVIIIIGFFVGKLYLVNFKEMFTTSISGIYSLIFVLYYCILHATRYNRVKEMDDSGIYHVTWYEDGKVISDRYEYQKHTGWFLGFNYSAFYLIIILLHNSIGGLLIAYILILLKDLFIHLFRDKNKISIIGIILSAITFSIITVFCLINACTMDYYYWSEVFYYLILPCICFGYYLSYGCIMLMRVYNKDTLSNVYLIINLVIDLALIICLISVFLNLDFVTLFNNAWLFNL